MKELHQAIIAIRSEVGYIRKDKKNPHHGYSYLSEEAIKRTLYPLFDKHGLVLIVAEGKITGSDTVGKHRLTEAEFTFSLTHVENQETLVSTLPAQGSDSLDKGVWKSLTGALKYFLTTTFGIPTGDDPEAEFLSPAQRKELIDASRGAGWSDKEIMEELATLGYKTTAEIPAGKFGEIKAKLTRVD